MTGASHAAILLHATTTSVSAVVFRTMVEVLLAVPPCVGGGALTHKRVLYSMTLSSIPARQRQARILRHLTVPSTEPRPADTLVRVGAVHTHSIVQTRVGHALVDVVLAVEPSEPYFTLACIWYEAVGLCHAGPPVITGI